MAIGIWLPVALLVAALSGAAAWRGRRARRADRARNDMVRAGQSGSADPSEASLRAQGNAAWMRMGGM
ncbi:hypothetical protein [Microbacterium xanthum]|uniref:hypothetical protein n=1 Tax=Microbacterium xanthum TaxID=3079794 RepID=UPI002AD300AB|nr:MULTISPECIES: hypothetical protein [unclassified Microbacterium]MDZ8170494.1 hypothetical protein [Microbacterium sp. KSW-48]MDZ8201016.1 hypothetical protein [Microbacterium sp. SSW1-59]